MHDGCSGGKLGDFGLLLFILLQLFLIALFLLRRIEAVVAGVELRLALVQLDHPGDHPVQKVAVMGNGQHRSLETGQIVFQPFHRVEIQMVGWFVQQQNIGIFQNQAPQIDPGLFPAGELLKLLPTPWLLECPNRCRPCSPARLCHIRLPVPTRWFSLS